MQAHHRDVVSDDIVQLPGNGDAVKRNRLNRTRLALKLKLVALCTEPCLELSLAPRVLTEVDGTDEVQEIRDDLNEHEDGVRREHPRPRKRREHVKVCRCDEQGDHKPEDHCEGNTDARPDRKHAIRFPRTDRVNRHKHGDVHDQHLRYQELSTHEEPHRDNNRYRHRVAPAKCKRQRCECKRKTPQPGGGGLFEQLDAVIQ